MLARRAAVLGVGSASVLTGCLLTDLSALTSGGPEDDAGPATRVAEAAADGGAADAQSSRSSIRSKRLRPGWRPLLCPSGIERASVRVDEAAQLLERELVALAAVVTLDVERLAALHE